ncbi:MAG TPA: choice-of-anchor Q domain-containing protein [Dokdonella sp.]
MATELRSRRAPARQCGPLAAGIAAGLLAGAPLVAGAAQAQAPADASWVRFRSDPARRLFAQLPAPRASAAGARPAATLVVTNCADDGDGSLRAAIAAAGEGDTIDLGRLSCARITLATGAIPVMLDELTITGPGADALAIDGGGVDRVFLHYGGGTFTLRALTVSGGRNRTSGFDVAGGGCIASAGYVNLDQAAVRDCYAGGEGAYGGAIYAFSLTAYESTLSGNTAYGVHAAAGTAAFGGAAFVYTTQLLHSTVSGNVAAHLDVEGRTSYDIGGGLISVLGGLLISSTVDSNYSEGRGGGIATFNDFALYNSTVSGNVAATSGGGGLFLRRPAGLSATSSTIAANHAATGGGVWSNSESLTLESSIVADNFAAAGAADLQDDMPATVAGSNDLIGAASATVVPPPDTLYANPRLAPLAYNGGPTRTHALLPDSPAIDAGNNVAALPYDQRGAEFARIYGAAPDIGAFERQAAPTAAAPVPVPTLASKALAVLAAAFAFVAWRERRRRLPRAVR